MRRESLKGKTVTATSIKNIFSRLSDWAEKGYNTTLTIYDREEFNDLCIYAQKQGVNANGNEIKIKDAAIVFSQH